MAKTYCFPVPSEPALAPPPGKIPDFQDPFSLRPYHSMTAILAILFTTTFVVLRLYTKRFIMKAVKWEDWLEDACLIGWALYVSFIAIEFRVIKDKGGTHQWNITYQDYSSQLRFSNYLDMLYAPSIMLIKLSILMLVLRLFCIEGRSEWFWWVIQTLNVLNTAFYIIHFFVPIFVCTPRAKIWDPKGYPEGKCMDVFSLYIASAVINVVSDVAMFFVPLWRIWQLNISRRRRAGVSAVFFTGGLAVISSVIRLIVGFELAKTEDYSYVKVQTVLWVYGELGFGIICSCFPIMPKLWRHVSAQSSRKGSSGLDAESGRRGSWARRADRALAMRPIMHGRSITLPQGLGAGGEHRLREERRKWIPLVEAAERGRTVTPPPRDVVRSPSPSYLDKELPPIASRATFWDVHDRERMKAWREKYSMKI